jgi:hypothetical protein
MMSTEARAESPEAKKRAFAELLARRARVEKAHTRKQAPAAQPQLARVAPVVTNAAGIPPASPVAPTGFGFGRDAFVEALYSQILGRPATEMDVVYWDRRLVVGVTPQTVADLIWFSTEHRTEQQEGTAPGIPLKTAYHQALAFGRSQQLGPSVP